jgi:asparagine synthase (glutamine-hydrolysing)
MKDPENVINQNNLVPAQFEEIYNEASNLSWQKKIEFIFIKTFLTDTVLTKTDRSGMAFGLEARVPFLDNEMADFAFELPFKYKNRGLTGKYLLRQLIAKRVPRKISHRPKQGFSVPLADWLRGELRYLIRDYLDPQRLKKEGIFNEMQIKTLVQAHLNKQANYSHLLWSIISFQMWKEKYLP